MHGVEQFPANASGATADRRGQGTMVEQARAASQVQGAVYLAREFPRDTKAARERMFEACAQIELAQAAFYSFPRGGTTVTGLTVAAACELALSWGNIDFGLTELRRDDEYGQSEMLAYAWELETNTRIASTFIVVHVRDTKSGSYRLTDARDVYEKNANDGNRRMRAAILKVLPRWYVTAAERALRETLRRSVQEGGKPLEQQIREAGSRLYRDYGVTPPQLEERFGRPLAHWTADDLVALRILGDSLDRGEIRVDEAFAQAKLTAEEIAAGSPPEVAVASVAGGEPHVHGDADPHLWDPLCVECREQAQLRGMALSDAEPLRGPELFRKLEGETLRAASTGELEDIAQRAARHRDYGALSQDEHTHLDVIGQQRYDALTPDAAAPMAGDDDA